MPEHMFYVRKLYDQELGYRKGEPKKAGRYFFISKKVIPYFPPLSKWLRNDHVILNVIPPHSDKIVLSKYVYHNDKIVDKKSYGRDEFRLYLNDENDPGGDYFKPGDIVVLDKFTIKDETAYRIYHYPASEGGKELQHLEELVERSRISGGHALVPESIVPFIDVKHQLDLEQKTIPKQIAEEELEAEFEIQPEPPLPLEIMEQEFQFTNRIRENSFRDLLLYFYNYKCAITGSAIKYKGLINLQAAHIIPDHYGGPAHPKNGIPITRDLHWAFDVGFFTIYKDYQIAVHDKARKVSGLEEINGKKLLLPADERAWPSPLSVKWHNNNVFGLFLSKLE